ncbi:isopentenyl phosphate kinase family protein [Candidatus Woesebacteria bacterium]|nr:isopentenyl phosphate kinase family protein [Candidatus Woesebacteria bacterium]
MKKIIIIKLGGSVITDKSKPFTARKRVIQRLAKEIISAHKKYKGNILISHGSGSFGHTIASKYETHKGLVHKDSLKGAVLTSDAATEIDRIVMNHLLKAGLMVKSFAPSSFIIANDGELQKIFSGPIIQALMTGVTPVIYGDVIMDTKNGFCIFSAEKIIEALMKDLSKVLKVQKIIFCTDTDGVYDSNKNTIKKITSKNIKKYDKEIGGSVGTDVTGGMIHKVKQSLVLGKKYGVRTLIVNGNKSGNLEKAIIGEKTTDTVITF